MSKTQAISIDLPTELTIRNLEAIHKLLSTCNASQGLIFNAEGVSKADTAGLQLLASYIQHCLSDGIEITWSASSEALLEACKLLDLAKLLNLPVTQFQ